MTDKKIVVQNELPIDKENPFAHCLFNREKQADALISLFETTDTSIVFAINAPWGYGKTTFLKMLKAKLEKNGTAVVYFSAWEHDYLGDPFGALATSVEKELIPKAENGAKKGIKKFASMAGKIAVCTMTKQLIGEIASSTLLNELFNKDTLNDIEKQISDISGELAENYIITFGKIENAVNEFKTQLENVAKSQANGKIYIIIDELDRCRPTYAVEMLERIKHIFSVPGVQFILGIDETALHHAIKSIYGQSFDAKAYLGRFIDYKTDLILDHMQDLVKTIAEEFNIYKEITATNQAAREIVSIIPMLAEYLNMDIRSIKQMMFKLKIVINDLKKREPLAAIKPAWLFIYTYHSLQKPVNFNDLYEHLTTVQKQNEDALSQQEIWLLRAYIIYYNWNDQKINKFIEATISQEVNHITPYDKLIANFLKNSDPRTMMTIDNLNKAIKLSSMFSSTE